MFLSSLLSWNFTSRHLGVCWKPVPLGTRVETQPEEEATVTAATTSAHSWIPSADEHLGQQKYTELPCLAHKHSTFFNFLLLSLCLNLISAYIMAAKEEGLCELDRDCPANHICYTGMPWLENENETCLCEFWHGWTGSNCTAFGPGAKVNMISTVTQLLVALSVLILCFRLGRILFQTENICSLPAVIYFLLVLDLLGMSLWRIATLLILLTPDGLTVEQIANFGVLERFHWVSVNFEFHTVSFTSATTALTLINMIILCTSLCSF